MKAMLEQPLARPHAICGQEIKLPEEEFAAARRAAGYHGWQLSLAPCVVTSEQGDGRSRSAGTMVAVPRHVHSEALWPFEREDL